MPVPTGYCTVDEIKNIFRALQDRIKIGPEDTDNLTKEQVEQFIYDVERRIDARIGFKYSTPLAVPADDVISQITRNQVAFDIYRSMPFAADGTFPDPVLEWRNLARELLNDIIIGTILLTVPTSEGTGMRITTSHLRRAREVEIRLTGTDWQAIGYSFIVPNSFIAAPSIDETFPSTYILNSDFEVMWKDGYMRRLPSSSISEGSLIYLYFLYQETGEYQKGTRMERFLQEEGYA